MSTFTVARHVNGCYEAFSFTQLQWKNTYSWIHHVFNRELLSFQGIYDPVINEKLAPLWVLKDYEAIKLHDWWFDTKQVIHTEKGNFNVYTGVSSHQHSYSKVGNGWCVAGNLLECNNYDKYFSDTLLSLTTQEVLDLVYNIPEKLDKRVIDSSNKGNYYEYTLYDPYSNSILKRETCYNK